MMTRGSKPGQRRRFSWRYYHYVSRRVYAREAQGLRWVRIQTEPRRRFDGTQRLRSYEDSTRIRERSGPVVLPP